MKNKAEFDLEKVFKAVIYNFYDELNYDYYSEKLDMKDKLKVSEYLLNETNKNRSNKTNFKAKADKILNSYYECPVKGNEFIKPITNTAGLTKAEKEWIENVYDVNYAHLLYNKKNIRVVVRLNYQIDRDTYWEVNLLDFVNDEGLTEKQRYQVYIDIYDMLVKELN